MARSAVAAIRSAELRCGGRSRGREAAEWGRIFEAASCRRRMANPMCTLAFLNMSMSDALQTLMVAFDKFIFTGNEGILVLFKRLATSLSRLWQKCGLEGW